MWCIPQVDGEYVARMEDMRAPDLKRPVVCFDESPTQLFGEVRLPIPADPCRARPDRATSDNIGLQIGPGGSICATTRSRSVTGTVSPAASRTKSFERFEANEPTCPPRLQWLERRAIDVRAGASRYEIDRAAGHGSLKEVESFLALPSQSSSRRCASAAASERPLAGLGITSKTRGSAQIM
jgi:hypothetical protein